ncbi:DUF1565 domain-containing protein [bacterium]|nr:DUF1565 domain-containing protein [bacterium]
MNKTIISCLILFILSLGLSSYGTDFYVDAENGANDNSGTSVSFAWKTITHALSQVSGTKDEQAVIHIAVGTYDIANGETFPLNVNSYVTLQGADKETTIINAYGSNETAISCIASDFPLVEIKDVTITLGGNPDLTSNCGGIYCLKTMLTVSNCILTENHGEMGGGLYSNYTDVTIEDTTFSSNRAANGGGICLDSAGTINRCTFKDNWVDVTESGFEESGKGGGIFIDSGIAMVSDCQFENNRAVRGGAIFSLNDAAIARNCNFTGNYAELYNGSGGFGGAICYDGSRPFLWGCSLTENDAVWGGGIYCDNGAYPSIYNCKMDKNRASGGSGGAIYGFEAAFDNVYDTIFKENYTESSNGVGGYGGAICLEDSRITLDSCKLEGNRAEWGGGVSIFNSGSWFYSTIITGNYAEEVNQQGGYGGGIYCKESSNYPVNCVISENTAKRGGGSYCNYGSQFVCNTNIISNNAEDGDGIYCDDSYTLQLMNCIVRDDTIHGTADVSYSNVEGGGFEGHGNMDKDPLFVTGPWGDYYLSHKAAGQAADSPCIDAGTNLDPYYGFNPNEYPTRTDGIFDSGIPDIGYHNQPNVKFGLHVNRQWATLGYNQEIQAFLDLKTANIQTNCDIYMVMLDPSGKLRFYPDWTTIPATLLSDFPMPGNISISSASFFTLPVVAGETSPLGTAGEYTFAIAATEPGTLNFISNLATVSFNVE